MTKVYNLQTYNIQLCIGYLDSTHILLHSDIKGLSSD